LFPAADNWREGLKSKQFKTEAVGRVTIATATFPFQKMRVAEVAHFHPWNGSNFVTSQLMIASLLNSLRARPIVACAAMSQAFSDRLRQWSRIRSLTTRRERFLASKWFRSRECERRRENREDRAV
jgi:hypothetical protein